MKRRILIVAAIWVVMTICGESFADQFSAEIEAKLKGVETNSSSATEDGTQEDSASDDGDGFLSDEKKKSNEKNVPFWLAFGPQIGMGPNFLFPPKNPRDLGNTPVAPFEDGGGGVGGGGGGMIATRFYGGRLGLDLAVFAERNQLRTNMTVNGFDNNIFIYKYSVARVPLLFRVYKLRDAHRFSLGLGPELIVGLESTWGEIRSDEVLETVLRVEPQVDLAVALDGGWAIKFNSWIVGIDLKFTYNITGPREFDERVLEASGGFEVAASHSLDVRLLMNMMYEIGFGAD